MDRGNVSRTITPTPPVDMSQAKAAEHGAINLTGRSVLMRTKLRRSLPGVLAIAVLPFLATLLAWWLSTMTSRSPPHQRHPVPRIPYYPVEFKRQVRLIVSKGRVHLNLA
jgi:hypothetical protein